MAAPLRFRTKALTGLAALGLALGFCLSPWGRAWDHFAWDSLFLLRGRLNPPPEVVVVAIDEPSFGVLGLQWPWPRSVHAQLIENLFRDGARVVALDIIFAEPSRPEEDARLAEAIKSHPDIILAADLNLVRDQNFVQQTLVGPWPELISPQTGLGLINLPLDSDGFVRRLSLQDRGVAPLAVAAAARLRPREPRLDPRALAARGGELGINFLGPARSVKTVSYYQALLPEHLPAGFFKDKLVFVGAATTTEVDARQRPADHFPTPFSRWGGGYMAGVEIHAQAALTLLRDAPIRRPPLAAALALGLGLGLASCLVFFRVKPLRGGLILVGELAAGLGAAHLLFGRLCLYLPLTFIVLPAGAAYLVSPFVHYWQTWKEKSFIRKAFATYLAPAVVQQLLANPERLKLGGEGVEATVLFADLAGFTTFSEKLAPQTLVELLNRCLGRLSEIVFEHDGMIDKYIGDAVMAVWGVPLAQAEHAALACRAALEMRAAVKELSDQEARLTGTRIEARLGISSGPMVAGNVGARRYFNYTVLGNEVNLASRLEGLNRAYGSTIALSEHTAGLIGDRFELRELDLVRVKGQHKPVRIYELQGLQGSLDPGQVELNRVFQAGRRLYRERRFAEAQALFEQALDLDPGDGPSQTFLERCREYEQAPPPEDWDGVYTATSK